MNPDNLVYRNPNRVHRVSSIAMFCVWLCIVALLARNHVVWRDEVRAYSFALQGHNVFAMLRGMHGEGHPALWYFLIRGGHALIPRPQILQIIAFVIAFASMLLLVFRSPFSLLVLALLLSSKFALFEYSVMARNYGISMLLLFILVTVYDRYRNRGILPGVLLFFLANCNVHSILLVCAFLLFWLLDLRSSGHPIAPRIMHNFLWNAALAGLGIVLCAVTVYPTINDGALFKSPSGIVALTCKALFLPAQAFNQLLVFDSVQQAWGPLSRTHGLYVKILNAVLMSGLLFGSTLGLIRRPPALFAAWASLIGFSVFFNIIYPGFYRQQALWLMFLISMYWIAGQKDNEDESSILNERRRAISAIKASGYGMFLIVLALQTFAGLRVAEHGLLHVSPESRSLDAAQLISADPQLRDAIIMADPDYLVESLPYYIPNQTFLVREHRFGKIPIFTKKATLKLSLDDILKDAREMHATTGKPVIILLSDRLDPSAPAEDRPEAYDWELTTTPEQVQEFLASAHLSKRFGPVSQNDETFDLYVVN